MEVLKNPRELVWRSQELPLLLVVEGLVLWQCMTSSSLAPPVPLVLGPIPPHLLVRNPLPNLPVMLGLVAVLASIYYGLGAVAQEKVGPGQCNAEFPVHYFYAWLDQYFPKLYMRLPLLDLGKLKDYVPEMLAIENIEAGKFDAKIARLFICHPKSFTWRPYKHGI